MEIVVKIEQHEIPVHQLLSSPPPVPGIIFVFSISQRNLFGTGLSFWPQR